MGTHNRLTDHIACSGCGYDLYALERAGKCPECALPISDSIDLNSTPMTLAQVTIARRAVWGVMLAYAAPWLTIIGAIAAVLRRWDLSHSIIVGALLLWSLATAWGAWWLARLITREGQWTALRRLVYAVQSVLSAGAILVLLIVYILPGSFTGAMCAASFAVLLACTSRHSTELTALGDLCYSTRTGIELAPAFSDRARITAIVMGVLYAAGTGSAISVIIAYPLDAALLIVMPVVAAAIVGGFGIFCDGAALLRYLRRLRVSIEQRLRERAS